MSRWFVLQWTTRVILDDPLKVESSSTLNNPSKSWRVPHDHLNDIPLILSHRGEVTVSTGSSLLIFSVVLHIFLWKENVTGGGMGDGCFTLLDGRPFPLHKCPGRSHSNLSCLFLPKLGLSVIYLLTVWPVQHFIKILHERQNSVIQRSKILTYSTFFKYQKGLYFFVFEVFYYNEN